MRHKVKRKVRSLLILLFLLSFFSSNTLFAFGFVMSAVGYDHFYDDYDEEDEEDEFLDEPEDEFFDEPVDEFFDDPVDEFFDEPVDEFRDISPEPFIRDEFRPVESRDAFVPPPEDDFVMEKREGERAHRYREPDLGRVLVPSYLYRDNSVQSNKVFELYRNDQVVILEESPGWFRVEFLGREGWVPMQDVRLEKWHTYRVSMELGGGVGSGGGDISNFKVLGNYFFRLNVSLLEDLIVGIEGKGISFDADALYAGGGIMLRYYIHGLRTKKSRSALTFSGGYIGGLEKPGSTYEYRAGEPEFKVFSGPYFGASVDFYLRAWERIAFGFGGHFNFVRLYGKTETASLKKNFVQGGAHISMIFNVLR